MHIYLLHRPSPGWQRRPCPACEGRLSKAALERRSCDSECDNCLFLFFFIVFTKFFWQLYQCAIIFADNEAAIAHGILKRGFFSPFVDPFWASVGLGASLAVGLPSWVPVWVPEHKGKAPA